MEDPIKVIHKYKNNDKRIQYQINIFIGDIVDDNCMRVLKHIKNLDLYSALTELDERDRNILVKNYGEWWYEKFYNTSHINFTKDTLKTNSQKSKQLKDIYGSDWYGSHILKYKTRYETSVYSYEKMFKQDKERKTLKHIIQQQKESVDQVIDYSYSSLDKEMSRTVNLPENDNYNIYGIPNKPYKIVDTSAYSKWCQEESTDSDDEYVTDNSSVESTKDSDMQVGGDDDDGDDNQYGDDFDETFLNNETPEQLMFEQEVENDMENVKDVFDILDVVDKNLKQNTIDLKAAISDEHFMKLNSQISKFNTDKDDNAFDENLKNVYTKNYIVNQYIFKDDTIKTIKNKICCGFKNNDKFGDNSYIIPAYQYLWSEYTIENKIEKVMLGQKWVIKNDLLKLDIEPNSNLAVYEDMRGNLKTLRDNIKRQGKIKREEDENSILFDYENYYTYNEIYLVDIYNELGLNYNVNFEETKNLLEVYLKIYFPYIKADDFKNITSYLKMEDSVNEKNKVKAIYETINNDIMLENEISRDIELVKKKNKDYVKIFKENYVTQSVIRAYLLSRNKKLDLFRIFDSFNLDATYPFIQFQPADGSPRFRFSIPNVTGQDKKDIILKWFENSIPGISFRVKINNSNRYMGINLNDSGQISYKIQWKEEDKSTVDDIQKTYIYIINLIKKINKENNNININLHIPNDSEFKFAFINTIQKFELPNDFVINHNDISEFSRYFFPYVALVIEPRKRQSKITSDSKVEKSKYGTYFRYKKVSKYENKSKIEHRIIFFMRNYEYDDNSLANEISKEFNITNEQSLFEINSVREKYPGIRKARKILKKLENIPKYKPPGIEVAIQGKLRSKYKMKIAGARDREQLDRIITFMNVLIYLYVETYLFKKPNRQQMKDKLKRLVKIAKRRNKVEDFVQYDATTQNVKQMISIDKKRLSYKADEDQNQWTRNCQNSGNDKKRRPQLFLNVDELKKMGYEWNDKLGEFEYGHYERTFVEPGKKPKKAVKLIALKLPLDENNDKFVYYTCGPEENGQHMYIGFLGKSKNPYGEGVPCCFIKDHLYSKNTEKRNFFLKSIGIENETDNENKISGDQLYILQDSAKIQEGRFAFLPKYLEIYLNYMFNHQNVIKNRYLLSSKTGYYFKYGPKQDENKYLNAICSVLDVTVEMVVKILLKKLHEDKNLTLFTSLNNGDVRTQFKTIDEYINYIKTSDKLDYNLINDLICLPGIISKNGINIIIFNKKTTIIKKNFDKVKTREDYFIICNNIENNKNLYSHERENILLIKESKNFYPIIFLKKINEQSKEIELTKTYMYTNSSTNIINHILKYYFINCNNDLPILGNTNNLPNAKETNDILQKLNDKNLAPRGQIIDFRFKCIYIITKSGYIIPTIPSGSIYNLTIINNITPCLSEFAETYKYMNNMYSISKNNLQIKPVGVHFSECTEKKYTIVSLITNSGDSIPIKSKIMTYDSIKKLNLTIHHKPNNDIVDKEIQKGVKNAVDDSRITTVAKSKYDTELYQLFRYHLSFYLNKTEYGKQIKNEIIQIQKEPKHQAKITIKKLLYKISDSKLYDTYVKLTNNVNKIINKEIASSRLTISNKDWIHIQPDRRAIEYSKYKINNNREMCYLNSKNACNDSQNCIWSSTTATCVLNVKQRLFIDFVNKVAEEFTQNGLLADEILQNGDYFVSDIVNFNIHTERPGEQVIVSSNINAEKLLTEIFGKNNVPKIGKKNTNLDNIASYDQLNYENPMKYANNWHLQYVIHNNNTIFRAFANSYFWIKHKYNDPTYRNLGYYSNTQSLLSNLYKSQVIDWLVENKTTDKIKLVTKYILHKNIDDFVNKLSLDVTTTTNCLIELFVLSEIYNIVINVYDDNYKILFVFDAKNGFICDSNDKVSIKNKKMTNINETINLLVNYSNSLNIPSKITCMYSK